MFVHKYMRASILMLMGIFMVHAQAQDESTLQDTTIFSEAAFTSFNSITAGPNLLIAATGDLTLATYENVYFKSGFTVVGGGQLQTINDRNIVNSVAEQIDLALPLIFSVKQNYPNPFNPSTVIAYSLPNNEEVSIVVYNALGQQIRNLLSTEQPAGSYSVTWDGKTNTGMRVSSGTYFYKVKAGNFVEIKKMILLR